MIYFKKLITTLAGGVNNHTFTDSLINAASVIEVYTDNDEVYPVNIEQSGTSVSIELSDHPENVMLCITINNATTIDDLSSTIENIEDDVARNTTAINNLSTSKQDVLTAGTNITIVDNVISATGGGGTGDYSDLTNKPSINNITLTGNKSLEDLGIASASDLSELSDIVGTVNAILEEV